MSKPILAGVIVVALAAGVGGYAVMGGAPAAPKGGCPALVSMAPYDANFIAFGDFATMRNSALAQKMNSGANTPPLPKEYQDFLAETNFHIERDLQHIMVEGSVDSAAAMVTTSAPIIEKNTGIAPVSTAANPNGAKPPCSVRLPKVGPVGEVQPNA